MTTTIRFKDFERVGRLTKVASSDTARPILAAVYIETNGKTVEATATDSYKLGHTSFQAEKSRGKWTALVPAKPLAQTVLTFKRLAKERGVSDPRVAVKVEGDTFWMGLADETGPAFASVSVELVDGNYPKWRALMVKPTDRVPASKLRRKSNDDIRAYLSMQGGSWKERDHLTKADLLAEVQTLYEESFDEREVALNPWNLSKLIESAFIDKDHHPVKIEMFGPLRPVWLTAPSDSAWVGILMPVRV